jgi:hypothetical protein
MTPAPNYADIASRAAASGIMVTAAGVEEIAGMLATPSPSTDTLGAWQDIATAPRDGTYILLRFDGPFHDSESPGVAIGKAIDREPGWWLTCIWAASTAHTQPSAWCVIPTDNAGAPMTDTLERARELDAKAKAIAASVVQSACETDPADPEHLDTVCIGVADLETIVRAAVADALEAIGGQP